MRKKRERVQKMDSKTVKSAGQDAQKQQTMEGTQPAQQRQSELAADKGSVATPKKKLSIPLIAAAAVVLVALIAGIGVYNIPANRLSRQLDLGNRYLENEQYAEAVVAFERAITIDDRNMEAYAGAVEAYSGMGDQAAMEDFYDRALTVIGDLDEDLIEQNEDSVTAIYLAADQVYGADLERATQILEEGFAKTGGQEIKNRLILDYQKVAENKTAAADFEEALVVYDRLLDLDAVNMETVDGLCSCLDIYIDDLMTNKEYDRIRELSEKYGNTAVNVDFATILAKIQELEKIEAENRAFMQKVYDFMAAEDYEGMLELTRSEEADVFQMDGDCYLYFAEDSTALSGIGAGIYTVRDGGCYFYYGAFDNGERKGSGTEFADVGTGYYVFAGEWDQDAPNGTGVETLVSIAVNGDTLYEKVSQGTLVNGLWNGEVESVMRNLQRKVCIYMLMIISVTGMVKDGGLVK